MRRALTLVIILLSGPACKNNKRGSSLADINANPFRDALFIATDFLNAEKQCQQNLFNAYGEALANGWLLNTAYSGLQTNSPVDTSLKTDSLYFQSLRVFSIFDWNLTEWVKARSASNCLPDHMRLTWAPVTKDELSQFRDAFPEEAPRLRKVASLLGLPTAQLSLLQHNGDPKAYGSISRGINLKQQYLRDGINQIQDDGRRLLALLQAYNPIYGQLFLELTKNEELGFEVLLPTLGEVDIKNIDQVKSWTYTPGLKKRPLPRQVDVNVAKLIDISYLNQNQTGDHLPAINIRVRKNLKDPHRVTTVISFGTFQGFKQDGSINLDIQKREHALVIGFIPHLTVNADDSTVTRRIKDELNSAVGNMKVDARIHQLNLELERDPQRSPKTHGPDGVTLQPKFKLRESELSFRIYQTINSTAEGALLSAVGFNCPAKVIGTVCYQDFGAFTDLNDYLTNDSTGPLSGKWQTAVGSALKKALNTMVKYNAKFLINWNIESIESALDQQFAQIFTDLLDQQIETREKIRDRIERVLFEELND